MSGWFVPFWRDTDRREEDDYIILDSLALILLVRATEQRKIYLISRALDVRTRGDNGLKSERSSLRPLLYLIKGTLISAKTVTRVRLFIFQSSLLNIVTKEFKA